jgi:hypothetical protein
MKLSTSTKRDPIRPGDSRPVYKALLQTRYNDKSELLEEGQNIWLEEVGGSGSVLINPSINHSTRTITFELSLEQILPRNHDDLSGSLGRHPGDGDDRGAHRGLRGRGVFIRPRGVCRAVKRRRGRGRIKRRAAGDVF